MTAAFACCCCLSSCQHRVCGCHTKSTAGWSDSEGAEHLGVVMAAMRMEASCPDVARWLGGDTAADGAAAAVAASSQPPPSSSS